ncbi:uncharacterized protein LOC126795868 [Argentina anserina]|uniref:uncharacterized protein LOC126795868 n=1 Tax=Argentina anserina TaxID=57926 RepID=UPI002176312C|nr:uncharacterized protein LOC126795868 [Potentilla anserina]
MAFTTLDELDVGVVKTFQPSEAVLVGFYLYHKLFTDSNSSNHIQAFPEICIYGETGLPPWEIWRLYQHAKFPHQEFIYFFSHAQKVNPNKIRKSRKVGSDGGTWSETETAKPVYVSGIEEEYGKVRKFRYEAKDTAFEHHGAWLMDEYTINRAPDLALCRLKVNDKGGERGRKNKRKFVADENGESLKSKGSSNRRKLEPRRSSEQVCEESTASFTTSATSQPVLSPYHSHEDESNYNQHDNVKFPPTAMFDENVKLNEAQLMASGVQVATSEQQEYKQEQQQDQASSSNPHEQQLLDDIDFDLMRAIDFEIPLDELSGYFTNDEDQLSSLPW